MFFDISGMTAAPSNPVPDVARLTPGAAWLASGNEGGKRHGGGLGRAAELPVPGIGLRQVLVVDDYKDTLDMVAVALEYAGFAVLLAESGPRAIALARQHRPAAIVMDIYMPGVDGIAATRAIRADATLAHIPVVAHTARPGTGWEKDLFDAVCPKPCGLDHLIGLINEVIAKGGSGTRPSA